MNDSQMSQSRKKLSEDLIMLMAFESQEELDSLINFILKDRRKVVAPLKSYYRQWGGEMPTHLSQKAIEKTLKNAGVSL